MNLNTELVEALERANLGITGDYDRSGEELVVAALAPLLARIVTDAKAEAWSEGYTQAGGQPDWGHENPYREESQP